MRVHQHSILLAEVKQQVKQLTLEEKAQLVETLLTGTDSPAILGCLDLSNLFFAIASWIATREI
ncbi:MAG: hypothetical protein RLP02_34090 [Coleofasciculus sp. C2-GNP5-27]